METNRESPPLPRTAPPDRAPLELNESIEALRTAVAALRANEPDSLGLDALANASAELIRVAEDARRDALRWRAVIDGLHDGVAETDSVGVVRTANQRLSALLEVVPRFLAGRPLLHFVARNDCRTFREVIAATASSRENDGSIIDFRPRRGASIFSAEVRARTVTLGPTRGIVWTIRPLQEPRPREEPGSTMNGSLEALVSAARQTIHVIAAARRITVTSARPTALRVHPTRARALLDAAMDVARVGLRLADEGATLPIHIQPLDSGEALVAFGAASLRLPLCTESVTLGTSEGE